MRFCFISSPQSHDGFLMSISHTALFCDSVFCKCVLNRIYQKEMNFAKSKKTLDLEILKDVVQDELID